jgi:hypothetical protein
MRQLANIYTAPRRTKKAALGLVAGLCLFGCGNNIASTDNPFPDMKKQLQEPQNGQITPGDVPTLELEGATPTNIVKYISLGISGANSPDIFAATNPSSEKQAITNCFIAGVNGALQPHQVRAVSEVFAAEESAEYDPIKNMCIDAIVSHADQLSDNVVLPAVSGIPYYDGFMAGYPEL